MNDFTTTTNLQITNDSDKAALLFEHIETFANGLRFRVQEKNENGRWGGRGTDVEFTVYRSRPTRKQVVEEYSNYYL